MMKDLNSLTDLSIFLKKRGNNLKPVNSNKIQQIEGVYNIVLPETYKQFLLLMGNGAGAFMRGSSVFFDELFYLKQGVQELIEENNLETIPEDAFVFWMHQGYQAAYFRLSEGNDPPVYYFSEGKKTDRFELKEKSLTDFFISQALFELSSPSWVLRFNLRRRLGFNQRRMWPYKCSLLYPEAHCNPSSQSLIIVTPFVTHVVDTTTHISLASIPDIGVW